MRGRRLRWGSGADEAGAGLGAGAGSGTGVGRWTSDRANLARLVSFIPGYSRELEDQGL